MPGQTLPSQRTSSRAALTLIDTVVTILLMGILAAAAVPRFSFALDRQRVKAAAQRICADIRWAKNSAIASSAAKRIDITIAQNRYGIVGVASPDKPGTDYSLQLADGVYQSLLVSANLGGDATLTFDLHGQPDSGGTIVIRSGGALSIITINAATGEATAS